MLTALAPAAVAAAAAAAAPTPMAPDTPSTAQPPVLPTLENTVIKSRWKLTNILGKGAFGEVYLAIDLSTNERVAIKVESPYCKKAVLKLEVSILSKLQTSPYVCGFVACGRFYSPRSPNVEPSDPVAKEGPIYSYLVMELLGTNLSDLRKRTNGKFSIATTALLAKQMLHAIEAVHAIGILHRDIKPGNFCLAAQGSRHVDEFGRYRCFLIDFGLARRYRSASGRVRDARSKVGFRGTARYASVAAHLGMELCRADDLWSLFYIIVEFLTGTLPWKGKEKDKIGRLKQAQTSPELFAGLPSPVSAFYNHLVSLTYTMTPDYAYVSGLMDQLFHCSGMPLDVPYDWDLLNGGQPSAWAALPAADQLGDGQGSSPASGSGHDSIEKDGPPGLMPGTPGHAGAAEHQHQHQHQSTSAAMIVTAPTASDTAYQVGMTSFASGTMASSAPSTSLAASSLGHVHPAHSLQHPHPHQHTGPARSSGDHMAADGDPLSSPPLPSGASGTSKTTAPAQTLSSVPPRGSGPLAPPTPPLGASAVGHGASSGSSRGQPGSHPQSVSAHGSTTKPAYTVAPEREPILRTMVRSLSFGRLDIAPSNSVSGLMITTASHAAQHHGSPLSGQSATVAASPATGPGASASASASGTGTGPNGVSDAPCQPQPPATTPTQAAVGAQHIRSRRFRLLS
ncbi:kinase-like domain-containing protein [Entophlyctis helioformis]|nr:kinase-like domain-containing protein [Entophlyctis helioformis]